MLPARRTRPRTGIERNGSVRCPQHLAWVRTHRCSVPGCDGGHIEAAHVRIGTDGGTSLKPSDCWVISLCADHHAEQHRIGERSFEARHAINMRMLALEFAAKSPSWQRHLAKQRDER